MLYKYIKFMKKLLSLFLFLMLLASCKKDVAVEQNVTSKTILKDSVTPTITVTVEESSAAEFKSGVETSLLDGFKEDSPERDTLNKPFVVINTQKKRLTFKNINPAIQKGYYDEDEIIYTDLGYSKKINKHLLYGQYYEGDNYFLIDNTTAKTDTINGLPNFSPDSKKLISYYVSPYNERKYLLSADVEIYDMTQNGLVRLHGDTYDYIPREIRWKGNNIILIKALNGDDFEKMQNDTVAKTNYSYLYKKIRLN